MRKILFILGVYLAPIFLLGQQANKQLNISPKCKFSIAPQELSFEVTTKECEKDLIIHSFTLHSKDFCSPAIIKWCFPANDIQFVWTPEFQSSLKPNWYLQILTSRATTQAPILCLINGNNQNKYSIAASDALNTIEMKAGVSEETSEIEITLKIYPEAFKFNTKYLFDLRIDKRNIPYWQTLKEVSEWWASFENYEPLSVPDVAKKPMYSTWYTFHQELDVQEVIDECRIAKSLGCETVIIDDGWQTLDNNRGYSFTGDWKPERIPNMKAFVDSIHQLGMKFILWYSVPFVGNQSEAKKRFEGKFLNNLPGQETYKLDPRYPEVREYLISIYKAAIQDWDIDGFKLDFVDQFKEDENIPSANELMDFSSVNRATDRLLTNVMKELKSIKPDILIEFRQRYIGPLMRKYGNMFRATDCPYGLHDNRIRVSNVRLLSGNTATHSDMLMWHPNETKEVAALQLLNVMFSVPQISIRLESFPKEHIAMLNFWLKFWNDHRDALLEGEFEPYYPNLNYPFIVGKSENTLVAGLYTSHAVIPVNVQEQVEKVYIINASGYNKVMVDFQRNSAKWNLTIYDCSGKVIEQKTILGKGIVKLNVPFSGLVEFIRLSI